MSTFGFQPPPAYSTDILAPPVWQGPPGQMTNYQASGSIHQKYAIFGHETQVLQVNLFPGESVVSQPGAMLYRGEGVNISTGVGGVGQGFSRIMAGESFFKNSYTNRGKYMESIAISPSFPAKIIPIDLSRSGTILAKHGSYIAHIGNVNVSFQVVSNMMAGCFGGNGLFLLKLEGNGIVFLNGGGSVMEKILAPGETLLAHHDSLVGFSASVQYGARRIGDCLTCCCGGEGLFNFELTGPGLVMIQSMSKERLKAIFPPPRNSGGEPQGQLPVSPGN
ncbi:hypothetical protein HK103_003067 [Boothiomyces macroporosus]|uniref:Altered inheritance of mitochondria protein 24, mitochondrial n=1 Tax=Boothiomyces macroporosus TaxID=261099 RepID=A0AAD5XZU9_9FUNG|nr:hypothetical protein HK103_003067 [Boothiomyces macroporosus]